MCVRLWCSVGIVATSESFALVAKCNNFKPTKTLVYEIPCSSLLLLINTINLFFNIILQIIGCNNHMNSLSCGGWERPERVSY